MNFNEKRRQPFLSEAAYKETNDFFEQTAGPEYLDELAASGADANDRRRISAALADDTFENFLLKYSAGELPEILSGDLESVVASFEQSARYDREFESEPRFPPLRFSVTVQRLCGGLDRIAGEGPL